MMAAFAIEVAKPVCNAGRCRRPAAWFGLPGKLGSGVARRGSVPWRRSAPNSAGKVGGRVLAAT
jgi:hypothetical protein